jgi:hypothetical protein
MFSTIAKRMASVGLATSALLAPGAALADGTGSVTGHITCGAAEDVAASGALLDVEGTNVTGHTDGNGNYTLAGLPSGEQLTVDASSDSQHSTVTSRAHIVVQPNQTLDIGSMDLSVCPPPSALQPAAPAPFDDSSAVWWSQEFPKGAGAY